MSEELIEYRVRPVTRYIVTRFERSGNGACSIGGGVGRGEFDNYETAYQVGYALAKADHDRQGWPVGDERIQYPQYDPPAQKPIVAGPILPDIPDHFPLRT